MAQDFYDVFGVGKWQTGVIVDNGGGEQGGLRFEQAVNERMIDDAQAHRAALLVLQAARRFTRGGQDVGIGARTQGFHQSKGFIADLGIGRDFCRVATQERQMMIALKAAYRPQSILRWLIAGRAD